MWCPLYFFLKKNPFYPTLNWFHDPLKVYGLWFGKLCSEVFSCRYWGYFLKRCSEDGDWVSFLYSELKNSNKKCEAENLRKNKNHIKAELKLWEPRLCNTCSKDKLCNFVMARIAYACKSAFQRKVFSIIKSLSFLMRLTSQLFTSMEVNITVHDF